jgi:hypothetical protein
LRRSGDQYRNPTEIPQAAVRLADLLLGLCLYKGYKRNCSPEVGRIDLALPFEISPYEITGTGLRPCSIDIAGRAEVPEFIRYCFK